MASPLPEPSHFEAPQGGGDEGRDRSDEEVVADRVGGYRSRDRIAQVAQQAEFTPRDIHIRDERVKMERFRWRKTWISSPSSIVSHLPCVISVKKLVGLESSITLPQAARWPPLRRHAKKKRHVGLIQRSIEAAVISTVSISLVRDITIQVRAHGLCFCAGRLNIHSANHLRCRNIFEFFATCCTL
jgi:hypothetical protein